MKTYNICWSGGVDSTFVITQLSQFAVVIHPFYIKGQTFRLSEPQELEAIASIRELLLRDSRTKAEILPPEVIEKNDPRLKNREAIKAHRRVYMHLLQKYKEELGGSLPPAGSIQTYADNAFFPPQDIAIASLSKYFDTGIEMGLTCDDMKMPVYKLFSLKKVRDEYTKRDLMCVDENANPDMYFLFHNIRFPVVGQGMHKEDLWKWYADNHYLQVRSKTIFCQNPVAHEDGTWEPCGACQTCIAVIHENVIEPFTEAGLARYRDYEENHKKEPERFRLKGF